MVAVENVLMKHCLVTFMYLQKP